MVPVAVKRVNRAQHTPVQKQPAIAKRYHTGNGILERLVGMRFLHFDQQDGPVTSGAGGASGAVEVLLGPKASRRRRRR